MAARLHLPPQSPHRSARRLLHAVPPLPPVPLTPPHVMPRPAAQPVRLTVVDCWTCRMHAGPLLPTEAVQVAGGHDDLRHAGAPTAVITADPDPDPAGGTYALAGGPELGGAA